MRHVITSLLRSLLCMDKLRHQNGLLYVFFNFLYRDFSSNAISFLPEGLFANLRSLQDLWVTRKLGPNSFGHFSVRLTHIRFLALMKNKQQQKNKNHQIQSSRSSVDRKPALYSVGHGCDSLPGLRFSVCPTPCSCWSVNFSHNSSSP